MEQLFFVGIIGVIMLMVTPPAHAIIFLPAIILIPIAKIVAVIIGGLTLPSIGLSALWSKLFKKSLMRTVIVTIGLLLVIALITGVILKIHNPDRPLF